MQHVELSQTAEIPGVYLARQKRSQRIRDSFINAGVELLNTTRFEDLTISQLAQYSGSSVGGFYTRFKDKDAYFRAVRAHTLQTLDTEIISNFNAQDLASSNARAVLEKLVDLMVDIFTSRYRGVLRESLLLILEPEDPWAPMRKSALKIVSVLQTSLANSFPDLSHEEANTQLRFCFQIIVGTLQNDLVNNYHVFTTIDNSLRNGLKDVVCSYMNVTKQC